MNHSGWQIHFVILFSMLLAVGDAFTVINMAKIQDMLKHHHFTPETCVVHSSDDGLQHGAHETRDDLRANQRAEPLKPSWPNSLYLWL